MSVGKDSAALTSGWARANARAARQLVREQMGVVNEFRVLLMDDEEMIHRVVTRALTRYGYEVVVVADGEAAVELYTEARGTSDAFAAVILDLTVPGGMGGRETLRRLQQLDPEVRTIICTGYADDVTLGELAHLGFKAVMAKPYRPERLAETLYRVIHGEDLSQDYE